MKIEMYLIFFFAGVCVWYGHLCVCTRVYGSHLHVEVRGICWVSSLIVHLMYRSRVLKLNPELANLASLVSQLA